MSNRLRLNNVDRIGVLVKSSNLHMVVYEISKKDLVIKFKNNRIYRYNDVPLALFHRFLTSKSKGKFFNAYIKDKFMYFRVGLMP